MRSNGASCRRWRNAIKGQEMQEKRFISCHEILLYDSRRRYSKFTYDLWVGWGPRLAKKKVRSERSQDKSLNNARRPTKIRKNPQETFDKPLEILEKILKESCEILKNP